MENDELVNTLIARMRNGAVRFSYRKADGTVRIAYGTLCQEAISEFLDGFGSSAPPKPAPPSSVRYFDIEKLAFRSFSKDRLLAIDSTYGE